MESGHNQSYCGDHFENYRNIKSLCCVTGTNTAVGPLYFKNKQRDSEKEIRFVVIRGEEQKDGKLDEGRNFQL